MTYFQNADGSISFVDSADVAVDEEIAIGDVSVVIEVTGGLVDESSVEISEAEYEVAADAIQDEIIASTASLIDDAEAEQAALDAARATVLAALALVSGLTVEEIEAALA
jgi:hypothetical protein